MADIVVVSVGLFLLVGTWAIASHRRKLLADRKVLADHAAQGLSLEASRSERSQLLTEAVEASERARALMAAELHDGPIQHLASAGYDLDRVLMKLERDDHSGAIALVEQVRSGLTDEVSLLRRMMSELRPPVLDERGLGAAISDYARGWGQREDFPTELSTEIAIFPAAPQIEIIVYRLVQEALRNVARHARADHVTVVLRTLGPAELELIVADDGVGFDVRRAGDFVRHGHFGLAGMRERVQAARGTFDVVSAPGEGTRIRALLPTSESLLRR